MQFTKITSDKFWYNQWATPATSILCWEAECRNQRGNTR